MSSVPTIGTLSYGSVIFDAFESSRIQINPIWDEAERTIICWEHVLSVRGWVTNSAGTTDGPMQSLLLALTTPGQELRYTGGKGWGGAHGDGLHVNGSSTVRDMAFGPKPRLISFIPLGGAPFGNTAARVEWQCSTRVPVCQNARYQGEIAALNFDVAYQILGTGLQQITVTGYFEIPCTRQAGSRVVIDNADRYRERIATPVPLGYRREPQTFRLSKDKRRIDFSWVDTQIPYPLPEGCVYAECKHGVGWNLKDAAVFRNVFSGSITRAPDQPRHIAVERWKQIVGSRITKTNQFAASVEREEGGAGLPGVGQPRPTIILDSFQIDEDVFGLTTHFSMAYTVLGARLRDIVRATGLFTPIEGTDFAKWRASLEKTAFHIRGADKVHFGGDAIVDLCGGSAPVKQATLRGMTPRRAALNSSRAAPGGAELRARREAPPPTKPELRAFIDPESSWIQYVCSIHLVENDRIIVHIPLAEGQQPKTGEPLNIPEDNEAILAERRPQADAAEQGGVDPGVVHPVRNIIQRISNPTVEVHMFGHAMRLGYHIPTPRIESVGGVKLVQKSASGSEQVQSAVEGVPVYYREWHIIYTAEKPPKALEVPDNPALGVPKG